MAAVNHPTLRIENLIERIGSVIELDEETAQRRLAYDVRRNRYGAERDELRRRWNLLGNIRLAAFFATLALLLLGLQFGSLWIYIASAVLALAFLLLIGQHRRIGRELKQAVAFHDINRESILRGDRDWNELPLRHDFKAATGHAFANDLDLFGHASLFHLLESVETPMGATRLQDWLLVPARPAEIRNRQLAVTELAPELEWRQELAVRGRLIGEIRPNPEPLLEWCEREPWLRGKPLIQALSIAGPVLFFASAIAAGIGWLPAIVCIVVAAANIVLTQVIASEARVRIALVAEHYPSISQFAQLLSHIEAMPGQSSLLETNRGRLKSDGHSASTLLSTLGKHAGFAVPPGTLLYLPLQSVFAWDVNVLGRLEAWQRLAGHHVRDWLGTIGDTEALTALAGLAHDQPTWTMPDVLPDAPTVSAEGIGHPLLPDTERVTNDVVIGPAGSFLLVTGSNMSGKSTLLRAIGVNTVLAGAGGPVCAARMITPPVRLWTSVRVEDSLERGVSFFMAELQRLKAVVDAANESDPDGRPLLYLLDEILQGTNTAERQIAARRVIRHLTDAGALGAVSTHDLTLAEGPELSTIAHAVHLRDTMIANGMSFDYKLRPGIANSTNALRLMDIVFGSQPTTAGIASD